jgi:hypothetical protein
MAMVAVLLTTGAIVVLGQETETLYLSGEDRDNHVEWEFYCTGGRNSSKWTTIGVPSNWELQGFGTYNYGLDNNKANEQGRYRRSFELPDSWKDKIINIVFEGVMTDTQVWVNGKSAGPKHQGGFYRFKYDITEPVKFGGSNLLEVTVSKVSSNASVEAAERTADYWVFGGIYRPVYLEALPHQFIEWAAVDAQADGTISVDVHLKNIANADRVVGSVSGPEIAGALVSAKAQAVAGEVFGAGLVEGKNKVNLEGKVAGIKPWTAETPYVYSLELSLMRGSTVLHRTTERFGFRTFEVRPGLGLFLNGRKIRLKGVNRHCFWPDSGRCLSREVSYDDVRLIKQMNMNAVRMSHYPPDVHFLEACDELGLYVLDELAGWQKPPYDTKIGKKLVREMVVRDVSHPCILFWDNGNEGGWNRELDGEFALYDPQQRTVLHPWENFNGIDTDHYESYQSIERKLAGSTIFMPTEFLHGLYDGGLGAGLSNYWKLMLNSPLGAGGFLWALVDEGVVRTDRGGTIDTDGNHAPDGILGPYRQKEGSFYAIKDIWSPIHIGLEELPEDFSGRIEVENYYDFTNLQMCRFEWKLGRFPKPWEDVDEHTVVDNGPVLSPDVQAGAEGVLELDLPESWRQANALYLTAFDPSGMEVWTWSWAVQKGCGYCHQYVNKEGKKEARVEIIEDELDLLIKVDSLNLYFSKETGLLAKVEKDGTPISFGNGPRLIFGNSKLKKLEHERHNDHVFVQAEYDGGFNYAKWKIYPSGWVRLDYQYELDGLVSAKARAVAGQFDLIGVTFDYPEDKVLGMKWVGRGPYRVWKNRTKGGRLDVWKNTYKDHIPGVTWDFPEFRGFYAGWHWVVFETEQGKITLLNGAEDSFLGVYRPENGPDPKNTKLELPLIGISLLDGIPAIGDKFLKAEDLGPEGQKNIASGTYKGTACFYFEAGRAIP